MNTEAISWFHLHNIKQVIQEAQIPEQSREMD